MLVHRWVTPPPSIKFAGTQIKYANPRLKFNLRLDCVAQSPINANLTLIKNFALTTDLAEPQLNLLEYNTNLIEADLQRKTNCYNALKPIDQVLIAIQFYASGGLLQVVGDTTGVDKSIVSLTVHKADAILEAITALTHVNCIMGY